MARSSALFGALLLVAGCGGGADTQAPVVEQATPLPGGSGSAASDATRLTILFTNNVDGEIEPCG